MSNLPLRYIFECSSLGLKFILDRPLQNDILDEEEMPACFRDARDENGEADALWDIVLDTVSDFEPVALGSFNLEEADAALQKIAIKNLEKRRADSCPWTMLVGGLSFKSFCQHSEINTFSRP